MKEREEKQRKAEKEADFIGNCWLPIEVTSLHPTEKPATTNLGL